VACGIDRSSFGFGESADAESGDSVAQVVAPPGDLPALPDGSAIGEDSAGAAVSVEVVADSVANAPEDASSELSVEERLDRLIEGQEALNRRFDAFTAEGATPNTGGALLGIAQVRADSIATDSVGAQGRLGEARQQVRNFGVAVVWSVLIVTVVTLLVRALVWLLDALAERNARRRLFYKRLVPIIRIVLWIFTAYFIIHVIFRVDAQGVVAAAAAVGVAVGFAAQDLLKNLFGGLILVFDQPFQAGDKISIGGTYGEVVSIGLRSTRMVTPDDNLVSVPNAQVVDQQVANANAGELNCQVVTDLYLPGWVDEAEAKRIAFEAASGSRYVFLNKPIVVLVSDVFKETFLTRVRVKAYVLDPRLEFLFQSDVTERARAGFREAGLLRTDFRGYHLVRRTGVMVDHVDAPDQVDAGAPVEGGDE
jgi:small-conductance mechanosensitive channel